VKSALQSLLVNRFTVLNIEEVNTDVREPIDAPPPSTLDRKALPWRPKWEKRLPRQLSANTLDAHRTSIILPIEIGTTDTSEVHSIVTPDSHLGHKSDIFHLNNENNQLER